MSLRPVHRVGFICTGVLCLLGCSGGETRVSTGEVIKALPDLSKTMALRITYVEGKTQKTVTFGKREDVESLLQCLRIEHIDLELQAAAPPSVIIEFVLPDRDPVELNFAGDPHYLQGYRTRYGLLTVDPKFFEKVNELVSKKAGRPINVLEVN